MTRRADIGDWRDLLSEADECAVLSREAASSGSFCAACGLLLTADALCRRALNGRCGAAEDLSREAAVNFRRGIYQNEVDHLIESAVRVRLASAEASNAIT